MPLDALLVPILLPLLAGILVWLLPRRAEAARAFLSVLATAATLLAAIAVFAVEHREQAFGFGLLLRVDALGGLVLLGTAVFGFLIAIYSLRFLKGRPHQRVYHSCLLFSVGLSGGVALANELVFLLICWGLLAVTLYLMIGIAGPDASEAARKTIIVVGGSDALLLLGVALWLVAHGSTRLDAGPMVLDSANGWIALVCFLAGAFAKAGAMPLHSWLPDFGERAPAPVSAFLPAALDKLLGIYLLVRIVTELFVMTAIVNTLLMFLGALTILGAVMMALVQHDLKRLLSFHAVSQAGYMILGIGTGTALGLAAGLFHMLNNTIYKSCLFLGAGVVEEKAGSTDLDRLGGLATRLPLTFATCLVAALAISGIPPFNGFASKWMIYQAVIESGTQGGGMLWVVWLAAAMLGSALTLASFVKVLHGVFLCKPSPEVREARIQRASFTTALPLVVLASLCVLFGVFAYALPLRWLIQPIVGEALAFPGVWWAGQAAFLLVLAIGLGWLVYALTMRHGRLRSCPTYIGGERMDETRITGVPVGPERHVEVTGVDFFRTVEKLPVLNRLYRLAHRKLFDLYEASDRATAWLGRTLSAAHSGLLSLYLGWLGIGLILVLWLVLDGGLS